MPNEIVRFIFVDPAISMTEVNHDIVEEKVCENTIFELISHDVFFESDEFGAGMC